MAENVSLGRAVLLRGHVGCGKTSLIRELAQMTGIEYYFKFILLAIIILFS